MRRFDEGRGKKGKRGESVGVFLDVGVGGGGLDSGG